MNTLVLLLVFNPFSWFTHKPKPKPKLTDPPTSYNDGITDSLLDNKALLDAVDREICDTESGDDTESGEWFYVTESGVLGYSSFSCLEATIDSLHFEYRKTKFNKI